MVQGGKIGVEGDEDPAIRRGKGQLVGIGQTASIRFLGSQHVHAAARQRGLRGRESAGPCRTEASQSRDFSRSLAGILDGTDVFTQSAH